MNSLRDTYRMQTLLSSDGHLYVRVMVYGSSGTPIFFRQERLFATVLLTVWEVISLAVRMQGELEEYITRGHEPEVSVKYALSTGYNPPPGCDK